MARKTSAGLELWVSAVDEDRALEIVGSVDGDACERDSLEEAVAARESGEDCRADEPLWRVEVARADSATPSREELVEALCLVGDVLASSKLGLTSAAASAVVDDVLRRCRQ